jgi:dCMP deaminase
MQKHQWYLTLAYAVSLKSKDPSTKVGCVMIDPVRGDVLAQGYNGFPRNWPDETIAKMERAEKYALTIHAEQNAIANASARSNALNGCIAYITHHPCSDCTKLMIQAGVSEVHFVTPAPELRKRWIDSFDLSIKMLSTVGIKHYEHNYDLAKILSAKQ